MAAFHKTTFRGLLSNGYNSLQHFNVSQSLFLYYYFTWRLKMFVNIVFTFFLLGGNIFFSSIFLLFGRQFVISQLKNTSLRMTELKPV